MSNSSTRFISQATNKRGDNAQLPDYLKEEVEVPTIHYYYAQETTEHNEENALAQEFNYIDGRKRYRVMGNAQGLYSPYNIYGESYKKEERGGRRKWDLMEVSQEVFSDYITFLQTRNEARLRIAERKLIV